MRRKSGWVATCIPCGMALLAALVLPAGLSAQASATVTVSATVLSPEATRSWQAAAAKARHDGSQSPGAGATLATIAERTERASDGPRRVVSVEYLRN